MIAYDVPVDFPPGSILVEATTTTKGRPGQAPITKTRRLSCACLTVLAAKGLAPGETHAKLVDGKAACAVPFLVMLAGTSAQVQAVAANLRSGRRAQLMSGPTVDGYIELATMPKGGYRSHAVKGIDGTVVLTLYLPWAVQQVPAERKEHSVTIANLPTRTWLQEETARLMQREQIGEAQAQHDCIAAWVVDRLDKAVSRPILADLRFRRFLFDRLQANGALHQFSAFTFGSRTPTMCWPKGSAAAIYAHASATVGTVAALNLEIEDATREWVARSRK